MYTKSVVATAFAALAYALPAAEPQNELEAPAAANFNGGGPIVVPDWATIENVTFAGSGCPAGSASHAISGDKTVINLSFDSYIAEKFPGSKPSDETKNCNVNLKVRYPPGFSLTIATTDVRGYTTLDKSCTATLSSRMWWSGQQKEAAVAIPIKGEFTGFYTQTVSVPTTALVWSQCGANGPLFNINTRVNAACKKKDETALISVDTQDTALKTPIQWDFRLLWTRC